MADKEIPSDIQKIARTLGSELKEKHGLNMDPLLDPSAATKRQVSAALGEDEGVSSPAKAALPARPSSVSGGVDFFTAPDPGAEAKRRAGPPRDKDGNPISDKEAAKQHIHR